MSKNFFFLEKIGFISQCTPLSARYNRSNDFSPFLYLPNNTICQTIQNTLLFPIQLLCSTPNVYHTAISWGLETNNSCRGPGMETTVNTGAIRNPFYAFFPVHRLIYEMVHCHHKKGFFSFLNVAVSSLFRQIIDPITLQNFEIICASNCLASWNEFSVDNSFAFRSFQVSELKLVLLHDYHLPTSLCLLKKVYATEKHLIYSDSHRRTLAASTRIFLMHFHQVLREI